MSVIDWTERTTILKDPDALKVHTIDGARHLASGAQFADWEFFIEYEDDDASPLEIDEDALVPSPSTDIPNQGVRFRLKSGTPGTAYTVTFRHVTNETPQQTDDHSFQVVVAER